MNNDFRIIGNKLLSFRRRLSMTQAEIAEAAGISDRTYADIERGLVNMRIGTFIQICNVLNVTPNEVLLEESINAEIDFEKLLEKLSTCTQKERNIAYELINVYLKGLK